MKRVTVIGSVIVNDEIRHQHEGAIEVSDAEADRLHKAGVLLEEPRAATKAAAARAEGAAVPADAKGD